MVLSRDEGQEAEVSVVSETRVSAERPHPHGVMCEKNLQLTVNALLCTQNPSQISMNPVPSSPSILPTSPLQSVLSLLRPVTQLVCSALLPSEEEFHLQSSPRLHHAHAHTCRQPGDVNIENNRVLQATCAPPSLEHAPARRKTHIHSDLFANLEPR